MQERTKNVLISAVVAVGLLMSVIFTVSLIAGSARRAQIVQKQKIVDLERTVRELSAETEESGRITASVINTITPAWKECVNNYVELQNHLSDEQKSTRWYWTVAEKMNRETEATKAFIEAKTSK